MTIRTDIYIGQYIVYIYTDYIWIYIYQGCYTMTDYFIYMGDIIYIYLNYHIRLNHINILYIYIYQYQLIYIYI